MNSLKLFRSLIILLYCTSAMISDCIVVRVLKYYFSNVVSINLCEYTRNKSSRNCLVNLKSFSNTWILLQNSTVEIRRTILYALLLGAYKQSYTRLCNCQVSNNFVPLYLLSFDIILRRFCIKNTLYFLDIG